MTRRVPLLASVLFLGATLGSAPAQAGGAAAPECGNQRATIVGTSRSDVIQGTAGDDVVVAKSGDDIIETGAGNDTICAGRGNDRVRSGRGFQDVVYAGRGNDVVDGGPGRNLLISGPGDDRMYGSSHYDTFESPGRNWRADDDLFVGRGRSDSFSADPGHDKFRGGRGRDRVSYFAAPGGIDLDLSKGVATGDGKDRLRSIETVFGSRHDDTIHGTAGADLISSSTGDDTVYGRAGNDQLSDGGGKDHIRGGSGDDLISSSFCSGSSDGDTRCQIDEPLPDTLVGGPGDDHVASGPGEDRLSGGAGADSLDGGDAADSISGGDGDDTLHGGNAAGSAPDADDGDTDRLDGGNGIDHCAPPRDDRINCET